MKNGTICVDGQKIGVSTTLSEFVCTHPSAEVIFQHGRYSKYRLGPVKLEQREVVIILAFLDEALQQIGVSGAEDLGSGWSGDLSESRLQASKLKNDRWLSSAYGIGSDVYQAQWGRIESLVDRKTGEAAIILSFISH